MNIIRLTQVIKKYFPKENVCNFINEVEVKQSRGECQTVISASMFNNT